MSIQEIIKSGGGLLLILLTLVEVAPIKINPWTAIGKLLKRGVGAVGRIINADVLKELDEVKTEQKEIRGQLEGHIRADNDRDAGDHRTRILRFNLELIRNIKHTREDFIEILEVIDFYERYCADHPDYPNSRAVHAIANIERVYDERLEKRDFACSTEDERSSYEDE